MTPQCGVHLSFRVSLCRIQTESSRFCIFICAFSDLLKFEDDDDFVKRVLSGGGSGPVVTGVSDWSSVYEAAGPDPGITPCTAHSVFVFNFSCVFVFQRAYSAIVLHRKRTSQTAQLFSELRIWGGRAWPKDHLSTIVFALYHNCICTVSQGYLRCITNLFSLYHKCIYSVYMYLNFIRQVPNVFTQFHKFAVTNLQLQM